MNIINLIDPETLSEALGGILMGILAIGPIALGAAIGRLRELLGRRTAGGSAKPRTVIGRAGARH